MRFRKKPVEIEAHAFVQGSYKLVAEWCGGQIIRKGGPGNAVAYMVVTTLEGNMTAQIGDWIIRGVHGEFYPCKPDIFVETYEPVEEA